MKRFNLCLLLLLVLMIGSFNCEQNSDGSTSFICLDVCEENISGTWLFTEIETSDCPTDNSVIRDYHVSQRGCKVTVSPDGLGKDYIGCLAAGIFLWSGSYPDGGGRTEASVTLALVAGSLVGTSEWTYKEPGWGECSGTTDLVGVKY
jgi:hypothetical protein